MHEDTLGYNRIEQQDTIGHNSHCITADVKTPATKNQNHMINSSSPAVLLQEALNKLLNSSQTRGRRVGMRPLIYINVSRHTVQCPKT